MEIGIDSRAAVWYRGTGMGTYSYQLMENLYRIDQKNTYRFFLPEGVWTKADPAMEGIFHSGGQSVSDFWERAYGRPVPAKEGMSLLHNPHNGFGLPKDGRVPIVITIHDLIPYVLPQMCGKPYRDIFCREMPRFLERAAHIIAVSHHTKGDLQKILSVPEEKITVIHEAPEKLYQPMKKDEVRRYLCEKYGIEKEYILYVGGYNGRKNLPLLVNAFARVKKEEGLPHALLMLGRENKEYRKIAALVEAKNLKEDVIFGGFSPLEDLPVFYNGATLFVFPSLYEGFGLPPLEAAACGVATLSTPVSALAEVMGDGAAYFSPEDEIGLAQLIHFFLENEEERAALGEKGRLRSQTFSWQRGARETLSVYEKIMTESSRE